MEISVFCLETGNGSMMMHRRIEGVLAHTLKWHKVDNRTPHYVGMEQDNRVLIFKTTVTNGNHLKGNHVVTFKESKQTCLLKYTHPHWLHKTTYARHNTGVRCCSVTVTCYVAESSLYHSTATTKTRPELLMYV